MKHRSHRAEQERRARSQLAQLITSEPLLRGALVCRTRSCGKANCRSQKGHKHRALYLATRYQGQRTLLYIPWDLEETVRRRLANSRRLG